MEKVLLVARLGKFFSDFEINNIKILQSMGYDVWCAGNFDGDNHKLDHLGVHKVHIQLVRSPLSKQNLVGYKQLVALMKEHDFKLVHCHMPVGAVFARLAAFRTGTKPVIYTAHGLQFLKGGPIRDWMLFYPVEKLLSRITDVLITINLEDYHLVSKKFHMKEVIYLNGIGIDFTRFSNGKNIRERLNEENGVSTETLMLLSVGELNKNKNHEAVIRGLAQCSEKDKFHYVIAGVGNLDGYLKSLVKELGVESQVTFLGWRDDIADLCKSADFYVFPSKREGLPVALMEAMSAGLPAIVSKTRGNTELIYTGRNGIICENNTPVEYAKAFVDIQKMDKGKVVEENKNILEPYKMEPIIEKMRRIYGECLQ